MKGQVPSLSIVSESDGLEEGVLFFNVPCTRAAVLILGFVSILPMLYFTGET